MAAIISVHIAMNAARPSPIAPVIPVIARAIVMVAAHAPEAKISKSTASRAAGPDRGRASPGELLTEPPHQRTDRTGHPVTAGLGGGRQAGPGRSVGRGEQPSGRQRADH